MFSRLFKKDNNKIKKQMVDSRPTAHPVNYRDKGRYTVTFNDKLNGVLFEDDGKTGYFYATNGDQSHIFDALQLFDYESKKDSMPQGQMFIVLNEQLKKAGIFYNNQFQAIFDFNAKKGCSRLTSPMLSSTKWEKDHKWNETMGSGLEP